MNQNNNNNTKPQGLSSGLSLAGQQSQGVASNQLAGVSGSLIGQGYGGSSGTTYTIPSYYGGQYAPTPNSDLITIRKVENGFILTMQGKEYIITDNKQVLKYLALASKNVAEIK